MAQRDRRASVTLGPSPSRRVVVRVAVGHLASVASVCSAASWYTQTMAKKRSTPSADKPVRPWAIYRLRGTPAAMLGIVYAANEQDAIAKAIEEFQIEPHHRLREPQPLGLEDQMASAEAQIIPTLMRPCAKELSQRIRHVVWPVGALII